MSRGNSGVTLLEVVLSLAIGITAAVFAAEFFAGQLAWYGRYGKIREACILADRVSSLLEEDICFGFGFFKRQILRRTHRYHTDEEFFSMLKTNLSASLRFHEARSSATFDLQLDRNHSTTSPDATPPMKIICFQLLSVCGGSEIGVNVQQQHLLQPNNGKILSW